MQTHFFNPKTWQYLTPEELMLQEKLTSQIEHLIDLLEKKPNKIKNKVQE